MANKFFIKSRLKIPSKFTVEREDISRNLELKFTNLICFAVREMRANKIMQPLKYHSPALEKNLLQLERKIP